MGNYNELLTLRNKIENTLNYQLSLSNLELYHSNLFAVVLEKSEFVNVNLNMPKKFKIKMYILFIYLLEKIF